jgi:hypothetical protein
LGIVTGTVVKLTLTAFCKIDVLKSEPFQQFMGYYSPNLNLKIV